MRLCLFQFLSDSNKNKMHYILYTEVGMFVGLTVRNTASTGSGASDVK